MCDVCDFVSVFCLKVTEMEFTEIIHSLTEASNVTFFQKSVDCSLPCLFLSAIIVSVAPRVCAMVVNAATQLLCYVLS